MEISKYLEKYRLTMREFAARADVSESLISMLKARKKDVMLSIALRICAASDDEITIYDLLSENIRTKRISKYRSLKKITKNPPEVTPRGNIPIHKNKRRTTKR